MLIILVLMLSLSVEGVMISSATCGNRVDLQFRVVERRCRFETEQKYIFAAESEGSTKWVEPIRFNIKSRLTIESEGKLRKVVLESGNIDVLTILKPHHQL